MNAVLREVREKHGWSQQEVAARVGANRTTVIRWEKGALPQHFFKKRLCVLFQMNSRQLGFLDEVVQKSTYIDPFLPVSSSLIGRDVLLSSIKQIFFEKDPSSVVVQGLPGVGKTTVLAAVASDPEITSRFDGVLWAQLGQQPNMVEIYRRWMSFLVSGKNDQEENAYQFHSIIGDRRFLIVVDDVWSLDHISTLPLGRNCVMLISTRLTSIAAYLSCTQKVFCVQPLSLEDGLRLFHKLIPEIVDHEMIRVRVKELVTEVGGLPLGITLIGNYLHAQLYSSIRRIQKALERLKRGEERLTLIGTLPQGKISLQSAIERSLVALSQEARFSLMRLSVLPPQFTELAALMVTNSTQQTLDELVDSGLLSTSDEGLYTLHQTIADYTRLHEYR